MQEIDGRDRERCVVTRKARPYVRAYIVPFSINSTVAALPYLRPILAVAERLLGMSFRLGAQGRIGTLGGSDCAYNVITLTPYLQQLWDRHGLVGFKPRYIETELQTSGRVVFFATFTFHWLPQNDMDPNDLSPQKCSADSRRSMTSESEKFDTQRKRIFEVVYTPGRQPLNDLQRLEDGHVCRVRFHRRASAERPQSV